MCRQIYEPTRTFEGIEFNFMQIHDLKLHAIFLFQLTRILRISIEFIFKHQENVEIRKNIDTCRIK